VKAHDITRYQTRLVSTVESAEFIEALVDIAGNSASQSLAATDVRDFLTSHHSVALDDDMKVTFTQSRGTWSICANFGPVSICYSF
jgi:hypothetical protein